MRSYIFASSYIKTFTISGWYWPPLNNISWLFFLNPIPLKEPELTMYACFGLIHLPHTESTWSETSCQLSQCGVRLLISWVNAEWDSKSTETAQKAPTFTKISSFCVDPVDVESHSVLTQSTWSPVYSMCTCPCPFSWSDNEHVHVQAHVQNHEHGYGDGQTLTWTWTQKGTQPGTGTLAMTLSLDVKK